MKYLFSKGGLRLLESYCFTNTLFAFDFDGTLAKLVKNPSDAKMSRQTDLHLRTLNRFLPVAIISGRSLPDMASRLNFEPRYLVGNHGLEGPFCHSIEPAVLENTCRTWCVQLYLFLKNELSSNGVEIEDKRYSIAIHCRKSRNKARAQQLISRAIQSLFPVPRVILGKSVFNLVQLGAPHRGMALLNLMELAHTSSAFYLGDDDTDEDVFSLQESHVLTVRVGRNRTSRAKYFLQDRSEVNHLLRMLLEFVHFRAQSSFSLRNVL
jgi:trehalose 6-phosphate phosphatase